MPNRMKTIYQKLRIAALPFMLFMGLCLTPAQAGVKGDFLYNLSGFTGTIPYNTPTLAVDKENREAYVLYQNSISVFNDSGMEIYRFGDDLDSGHIVDITLAQDGEILLLTYRETEPGKTLMGIVRCNFRGEPTGKIAIKNLPDKFAKFSPNRMIYHRGDLYLANLSQLKIVLTDSDGGFRKGYDLVPLLGLKETDRGDIEMSGFAVTEEEGIIFTIPVLFSAYSLDRDGKLASFGKPGSAPGKFNIIAGIVTDSRGNYLVVDKLKCAVMVFDKNFNYLTQFGYRGLNAGDLIAPHNIAIDWRGRVYVTQNGKRGVSVYRMTYN